MAKGKTKTKTKTKKKISKKPAIAKKAVKKVIKKTAKKIAKKAVKKNVKMKPSQKAVKSNINWSEVLSPVDDRMLVELTSEGERVTAGGLIIPDTVMMPGFKTGKVLSVGPGRRDKTGKRHALGVEKNETVIFNEYSGIDIEIFGKNLKLVQESEILGVKTK